MNIITWKHSLKFYAYLTWMWIRCMEKHVVVDAHESFKLLCACAHTHTQSFTLHLLWHYWRLFTDRDGDQHTVTATGKEVCNSLSLIVAHLQSTVSELCVCTVKSNMCFLLIIKLTGKYVGQLCFTISWVWVGASAQSDPRTMTIFWSTVHPHLLYSACSPIPLTEYSILHNGISSQLLGSTKMFT
jgi:hypothetical protein